MLKADPEAAAAVTRALMKGAAYVSTHQDEVAKMMVEKKYVPGNPDLIARLLKSYNYVPSVDGGEAAVKLGIKEMKAIGVLEAAREQKKFEPVLETLMRNQPVWAGHGAPDPKKVWEFAVAVGLDRARAQRYLATGAVETLIKREVAAVEAADIRGTPTFFVNGKLLSELGPQQLSALVAAELQRTRKKP